MNERLQRLTTAAAPHGPRLALISLYDIENNAVRLLAAILRRAGHQVIEVYFKDWISNHLEPASETELANLMGVLRRQRVQLALFSLRASAYHNIARILTDRIHDELGIPVLWGGMHPTLKPRQCLQDADLVLVGEGELAAAELADNLRAGKGISDVRNLGLTVGGEARINELRPLITDLDSLPFRDYTSREQKYLIQGRRCVQGDPMYRDPIFQILASRGCIYRCAYCYNSTFKKQIYPGQRWYRTRSVDSVLREIQEARQRWRIRRVRFDDEVFNFQKSWFKEFCERYPKEIGLPFEVFVEPKLVTDERIRAMAGAGLDGIYMGIQASERVTDQLYDRHVRDDRIRHIPEIFKRHGVRPHYQLIFDDPVATEHDKRALFELICSFPAPFDLYLFSLTVFPGSELNHKLMKEGVITEYDIEGLNTRTFYQHRVNLQYPRPVEDTFWISLIQLLSKDFVPRALVRPLTRSRFLRRHPWPLIQLAHATNMLKTGAIAGRMVLEGEMTTTMIRRWLHFNRIITT